MLGLSSMMMDGVPSWSQHQNLQEDGMVQVLFMISLLADIPQLGATMILVMAPKLQEERNGTKGYFNSSHLYL